MAYIGLRCVSYQSGHHFPYISCRILVQLLLYANRPFGSVSGSSGRQVVEWYCMHSVCGPTMSDEHTVQIRDSAVCMPVLLCPSRLKPTISSNRRLRSTRLVHGHYLCRDYLHRQVAANVSPRGASAASSVCRSFYAYAWINPSHCLYFWNTTSRGCTR